MTCECLVSNYEHQPYCDLARMPLSKAGFVDATEGAIRAAFESYRILLGMKFSGKAAVEMAVEEIRESAACFAGIGSCGGGGCKHA